MRHVLLRFITTLLALLSINISAYAELIQSPRGLIDTNTYLEWLDIDAAKDRSYDAVMAGYGGFIQDGWRYASIEEVKELFRNAGADIECPGACPKNASAARRLVELLGYTVDASNDTGLTFVGQGITSSEFENRVKRVALYSINDYIDPRDEDTAYFFTELTSWAHYSSPEIGSFLVRSAANIPQPSTLYLFAIAFSLLMVTKLRKRLVH